MKDLTIMFFPNGVTAVVDKQEQVLDLQVAWLRLYFDFLESKGVDLRDCRFLLPAGNYEAVPFKTSEGEWNWHVEREGEKDETRH